MNPNPHLSLRVIAGVQNGKTFRLSDVNAVGRASDCAIVVAESGLSRWHFEIRWDGEAYQVTDLGSTNGTLLNGQRISQAPLRPGDEVQAGPVIFRLEGPVAIFPGVEPTLEAASGAPEPGTLLAALASSVGGSSRGRLYAIVDGAQAFPSAFTARLMGHELYTVFSGELAGTVAHVGPCLVRLGETGGFLGKWVEKIGTHAGVLFESPASLEAIHAHLREIFVATDEQRQEYFFRFYDPRVIRTFLPTCHPEELKEFFGPVVRWVVESEDATSYVAYTLEESALKRSEVRADP